MENWHEKENSPSDSGRSERPGDAGSAGSGGCCPPGSSQQCCPESVGISSGNSGTSRRSWGKLAIFVAVILAALAVGGYSLLQKSDTGVDDADRSASALCCPGGSASCSASRKLPKNITRLTAGKEAVFVLLPGQNDRREEGAIREIEGVVSELESRRKRVAAFPIGKNWEAYNDLVNQYSIKSFPCVMVLNENGQAAMVNGNITEKKLLRAYAQASKPALSCGVRCDPTACGK